jgi:aspartate racemase
MEPEFYKGRLAQQGLEVFIPTQAQRYLVHSVIYQELCLGLINPESKKAYLDIVQSLTDRGAQTVILGCTEIGLLIKQGDTNISLYDTTKINANVAVTFVLD